jgi:endo-1,4-beta-xylanase
MVDSAWIVCAAVAAVLLCAETAPTQGSPEADQAALGRAADAVDSVRKGHAVVTVTDADGNPVPGAKVTVSQVASDFRAGCNIFGFDRLKTPEENETYKQRFAEIFDFATLPFYWRGYEPERGKPHHEYRETVARWCQEHGIRTKGHPLCWTNDAGTPKWLEGLPATEKRDLLEGRVRNCVSHFAGLIDLWDVVNEPTHLPPWPTFEARADYVEAALRWAREANPDAYLIVNEYYVIQDTEGKGPFYELVDELLKRDAPFDAIGMQCHEPRTDWYPLDMVEKTFAKYAELGKPIHVTEFTPTSGGKPITGSHHQGTWTEQAQADYAEQFFRIAFAQPAVECIVWWDLAESRAWLEGGGLLRKDLTPKLVYDRIRDLVREEWRTNMQAETDADGQVALRGFCGDYEITAQAGDRTAKAALHIARGDTAEVAVALR